MRAEFAKLDTDNSGSITKEEMLEVIAVTGDKVRILDIMVYLSSDTQMEEAKAAIDLLDVDKDGKVSYPEFILVMKYKK